MIATGPLDVLLLSAAPARHTRALRTLRARGLRVRHTRLAACARRMLDAGASVIVVDVMAGGWIDAPLVHALNGARRASLVLALHEGALAGAGGDLGALAVDGYCDARDWSPIARLTAPSRPRILLH